MHSAESKDMERSLIRAPKERALLWGLLIIFVHILLLIVVIPAFSARLSPSYNQEVFADGYDYLAGDLADGHGYRFYPDTALTLMREPGYPLLLAGLRLAFGEAFIAVRIVNLILALGTAWLITRVVGKFSDRKWPDLVAITLFLFHPGTLVAESRGGVEILFGFLILLFISMLYRAIENNKASAYFICGLILGLCVLVRSVPLLLPVFLLFYLWAFERKKVSALVAVRNVTVIVLAVAAVLSPWIIRNYLLTKKIVPTASVMGVSAQAGQYIYLHRFEGKPWWLLDREAAYERDKLATQLGYPYRDVYYQTFYRTGDEIKFSNYLLGRVVSKYRETPGLFVGFVAHNLFNFWFTGKTPAATRANILIQLPYLLLAGAGIVIGLRNHQQKVIGPILLLTGYVISVYVPILAQARYSVPLIPFLSILAAITFAAAEKKMTTRKYDRETTARVAFDESQPLAANVSVE